VNEREKPKRRWFQFGLGTLLLSVLFLSCVLSAWRTGYRSGYRAKEEEIAENTPHVVTYDVADLVRNNRAVPSEASVAILIELIESTVEPRSWERVGGPGSISADSSNARLVVCHFSPVHKELAELFAMLRQRRKQQSRVPQTSMWGNP
jgi:hypothetical protein